MASKTVFATLAREHISAGLDLRHNPYNAGVMKHYRVALGAALALTLLLLPVQRPRADDLAVDTALVVSVDVSNSVDEVRYKLQMEGIAKALEDPGVVEAITGGSGRGILFSMVTWADTPAFVIPWLRITNKADAAAVAQRIRKLPHQGGDFTCMTRMLRSANDKIIPQIPGKASRIVIDVSGDGPDNCNAEEPIDKVRDELVNNGVTINGLPILSDTPSSNALLPQAQSNGPPPLEQWYRQHVMAGPGSFVLPAQGYGDFERAIRQKFVIEMSGIAPAKRSVVALDGKAR